MNCNSVISMQWTLYLKNPCRSNSKHLGCALIKFCRDINYKMNYRSIRDTTIVRLRDVFSQTEREREREREREERAAATIIYSSAFH